MATRYAVATGNWDNPLVWSASSGGPAGASVPTLDDDVVFNASSGVITVTCSVSYAGTGLAARLYCKNLTCTGFTGTLSGGTPFEICGDITLASGMTFTHTGGFVFVNSGSASTQTIVSAGKTLGGLTLACPYGTVVLGDNLTCGAIFYLYGTLDTSVSSYNLNCGTISFNNYGVCGLILNSSTVTTSGNITIPDSLNVTFSAANSTINFTATSPSLTAANRTLGTVGFTSTTAGTVTYTNTNTILTNLTVSAASSGIKILSLGSDVIVTNTLTISGNGGGAQVRVFSNTLGTQRTITAAVYAGSATDVTWRDIVVTGAAAPISGTRFGDMGNNSGITMSAPKTVYWNLAGSQTWTATAWATSSGASPGINNYPLPQDTGVFDDAGSITTLTLSGDVMGTVDMSARTSAMTVTASTSLVIYGGWKFGSGVTSTSNASVITFRPVGTMSMECGSVAFNSPVTIDTGADLRTGTIQLSGAFLMAADRTFTVTRGTFDANNYNVTCGAFSSSGAGVRAVKAGSGVWSLSGIGTTTANAWTSLWDMGTVTNLLWDPATAELIFSGGNNRSISTNGLTFHKITISTTTGNSSFFINGSATSFIRTLTTTITTAHTVASNGFNLVGYWDITGTVGNVVQFGVSGQGSYWWFLSQANIDYISVVGDQRCPSRMLSGQNDTVGFWTGPNSSSGIGISNTAYNPRTLYWVGGSGTTGDINRYSLSSGGPGGEPLPQSMDTIIFDANSNATSYTVTVSGYGGPNPWNRFGSMIIDPPASGTLTFTNNGDGGAVLQVFGSFEVSSTNVTFNYSNFLSLWGHGSHTLDGGTKTFAGSVTIYSDDKYTLANNFTTNSTFGLGAGVVDFDTYDVSATQLSSDSLWQREIDLGSGTTTLSNATPLVFGTAIANINGLTIVPGTSTIVSNAAAATTFNGVGKTYNNLQRTGAGVFTVNGNNTFNNVEFNGTTSAAHIINGINTFNDLTLSSPSASGVMTYRVNNNQTINGTLLLSGASARRRILLASGTVGTQRTISVATNSGSSADTDFRDIAITGAASPISGTRFADLNRNSGIAFDAPKTVYWNLSGTQNWDADAWALSSGGSPALDNFPLAQDTAIFDDAGSAGTITFSSLYATPSVDCSTRTSAMTFNATGTISIYGSFTLSSDVVSGTLANQALDFLGSGSRTITSAGKLIGGLTLNMTGGTLQLQDSVTTSNSTTTGTLNVFQGILDLQNYSFTTGNFNSSGSVYHGINFGSSGVVNLNRIECGNFVSMFNQAGSDNGGPTPNFDVIGTCDFRLNGATVTARSISPRSPKVNITFTAGAGIVRIQNGNFANSNTYCLVNNITFPASITNITLFATFDVLGHIVYPTNATTSRAQTYQIWNIQGPSASITANSSPINFLQIVGRCRFEDAATFSSAWPLTQYGGELDLNGYTITCPAFYTSNNTTGNFSLNSYTFRSGGGSISVFGNASAVFIGTRNPNTNFVLGANNYLIPINETLTIDYTYTGSTGTRTFQIGPNFALNFASTLSRMVHNVQAGSDLISIYQGTMPNFNFSGFTGTLPAGSYGISGTVNFNSGMTITAGVTFTTLNSPTYSSILGNGATLDVILNVSTPLPSYYKVLENQNLGSTRTVTINGGGIDFNDFNFSVGLLASSNAVPRIFDFGSSTVTIEGAGNAWNVTTGTNVYTILGSGVISMTSASAKTFIGGGRSWPTLNQGGDGSLSITGNNTFANITNTNPNACTIIFPNATTTVSNFTASGTAGNLLTLARTGVSGTFTLSKTGGVVGVDYISVSNSIATGGAAWYAGGNSTDGGNNTGWIFAPAPPPSANTSNMFFVFM